MYTKVSITVVGHSLGATLALLAADELRTSAPRVPPIVVLSFGGPRVGDAAFTNRLWHCSGTGGSTCCGWSTRAMRSCRSTPTPCRPSPRGRRKRRKRKRNGILFFKTV
uniref:Fungal lipase-type domain-containing protein n=1 Tax=Ananas comosus var. bracteatus TaxID=296719 RepID=A0A6V7PK33_ANACO|nr:unnamed protein product [Ananas comosus var. bracteatus]